VYVSRPLFIEEHGLRLLLEQRGTGVELSRSAYEAGDWANAVGTAWVKGREAKAVKLERESKGEMRKDEDVCTMASRIHDWVWEWWATKQQSREVNC
jgi:hypothetical protein